MRKFYEHDGDVQRACGAVPAAVVAKPVAGDSARRAVRP
jgi:hypothetical protein